ncbi:unnamed protein product [Rhodiola kirilowii]
MGDAKAYMDKIYEKLGCLLLAASKRKEKKQMVNDLGLRKKSASLSISYGDLRSCFGSELSSSNVTKDLYPIE